MAFERTAARQAMMRTSYKLDVVLCQAGDIRKQVTGMRDQLRRMEIMLQKIVYSQRNTTEPALGRSTPEGNFKYPSTGFSVVATGWENPDEVCVKNDARFEDGTVVSKSEGVEFTIKEDLDCAVLEDFGIPSWLFELSLPTPDPIQEPTLVKQWPQSPKEYLSQPHSKYQHRQWNPNFSNERVHNFYKSLEPLEWNQQNETNLAVVNNPDEAKFDLAQLYVVGRADKRLRCTGLFWKLPPWPDFCTMNYDRIAQHSDYKVLVNSHSVKQYNHIPSVLDYTDKFKELVKIWPFVNEAASDTLEDTIKHAIDYSITWPVRKVIPIISGDYNELELKSDGTLVVNLMQARELTNKDADIQSVTVKIYDNDGIQEYELLVSGGTQQVVRVWDPGRSKNMRWHSSPLGVGGGLTFDVVLAAGRAQTFPKIHHCYFIRLTLEYCKFSSLDSYEFHACKFNNPKHRHYVILSKNIIAAYIIYGAILIRQPTEFSPLQFNVVYCSKGYTGNAIVYFTKDWIGFKYALAFQNYLKSKRFCKMDWNETKQQGQYIYGWPAEKEDYKSGDPVGRFLSGNGDLKTVADLEHDMSHKNWEKEMALVPLILLSMELFSTEDFVKGFIMFLESAKDTALDTMDTSDELGLFLAMAKRSVDSAQLKRIRLIMMPLRQDLSRIRNIALISSCLSTWNYLLYKLGDLINYLSILEAVFVPVLKIIFSIGFDNANKPLLSFCINLFQDLISIKFRHMASSGESLCVPLNQNWLSQSYMHLKTLRDIQHIKWLSWVVTSFDFQLEILGSTVNPELLQNMTHEKMVIVMDSATLIFWLLLQRVRVDCKAKFTYSNIQVCITKACQLVKKVFLDLVRKQNSDNCAVLVQFSLQIMKVIAEELYHSLLASEQYGICLDIEHKREMKNAEYSPQISYPKIRLLSYKEVVSPAVYMTTVSLSMVAQLTGEMSHGHADQLALVLCSSDFPENALGGIYGVLNHKKYLYVKSVQHPDIWKGKTQKSVEDVPCGDMVAVGGLDQFITKDATLTNEKEVDACPIRVMKLSVFPVVGVAVQCELVEIYNADIPADSYKTHTCLNIVTAYDFVLVRGTKTLDLAKSVALPSGKYLFDGVVDGHNFWADGLAASLGILQSLESIVGKDKLVMSTSRSFMHLVVDLVNEAKLDTESKSWLPFTAQKVAAALKCCDHRRATDNSAKLDAQQKLNIQVLPTTTIGSFPQTVELRRVRHEYKANKIFEEEYISAIKEGINKVVGSVTLMWLYMVSLREMIWLSTSVSSSQVLRSLPTDGRKTAQSLTFRPMKEMFTSLGFLIKALEGKYAAKGEGMSEPAID